MGVDPWVDITPYFLKWRRRPVFCPPTFWGVYIFGTNAHGIHCMIGAVFVKYSQLIPMQIINTVAIRCQI